jgi:GNAT superfamily N-acetyltransferase
MIASSQIHIRPAITADAPALSQLICDNAKQSLAPHYSRQQMAVFLSYYSVEAVLKNVQQHHVFCAERDGQIVGTVALNGDFVVGFYTHLQYRGLGVGQTLMAHLHRFAQTQGLTQLQLLASPIAVSFYVKLGYRNLGLQKPEYLGVAFDETLMCMDLRPHME